MKDRIVMRKSRQKLVTQRIVSEWESGGSPSDLSTSPTDVLGVKGLTILTYNEQPLRERAEAMHKRNSCDRKKKSKRLPSIEVFTKEYIARKARDEALSILICRDHELILESRQIRVLVEILFPKPDDHFNLNFLFDATEQIQDGIEIVPESTSNANCEQLIERYTKGCEQVGIMLRRLAHTICPRAHAHFAKQPV